MIATSGFLAALKCTKFTFGKELRQGTCCGSLQHSPGPLSWFKEERTSKGKGREKKSKEEREERRGNWGGKDAAP